MKLALRWFGQPHWDTSRQTPATIKQAVLTGLEQAAQTFVRRLLADAEPSVWQTTDAKGRRWWNAHDPVTGRSLYNASEAEMRVWIEQRHYSIES